jgi:hypothetical protein
MEIMCIFYRKSVSLLEIGCHLWKLCALMNILCRKGPPSEPAVRKNVRAARGRSGSVGEQDRSRIQSARVVCPTLDLQGHPAQEIWSPTACHHTRDRSPGPRSQGPRTGTPSRGRGGRSDGASSSEPEPKRSCASQPRCGV